ncbi:LexA family protein [Salinicola halimionae]|uniref:LexA family protein n=1 Tax=Salinicola halimionae TaxID=1949081 RepID=UPI001FD9508C|nr:S24 family peptidase [Salinicola halimionae]
MNMIIDVLGQANMVAASVPIPLAGADVRAGLPSPADDYTQGDLNLTELLIPHPSSTFMGRAKGQSMERHGIYDGNLLIVDRSLEPQIGDVVVMAVDVELTCKQLRLIGKRHYLSPATSSSLDLAQRL